MSTVSFQMSMTCWHGHVLSSTGPTTCPEGCSISAAEVKKPHLKLVPKEKP